MLAAVTVNTAADVVDGNTFSFNSLRDQPGDDGLISLREALAAANNTAATDTIFFDASVFDGEADDVIRLQSSLVVTESIQIDGGGFGIVVSGDTLGNDVTEAGSFITDVDASLTSDVLGDNANRVFDFVGNSETFATISGLTITGGSARETSFSGEPLSGIGGGIRAEFTEVTLNQTNVSGNRADTAGGGIGSGTGQVTIDQSTISGNVAQTFTNPDSRGAEGGGVSSLDGNVVITNSTISGNTAAGEVAQGGGVNLSSGNLSLSGSTISGNVASSPFGGTAGGGLFVETQSVSINDSTITENTADFGGGITVDNGFSTVNFRLENTIIANNNASSGTVDIATSFSVVIDASSSLIGDNSGTSLTPTNGTPDSQGNLIGVDGAPINPQLEDLADNGGLTETHALIPGSPAVDAGFSSLDFDQRGEARVIGSQADIGAFELQGTFIVVDSTDGFRDFDFSPGNFSLQEAIDLASSTSEVETIVFDPAVFNGEANAVIHLQEEIFISDAVTIDASDLGVVISGDRGSNDILLEGTFITDVASNFNFNDFDNLRPITINTSPDETVILRGLTITGGFSGFRNLSGGAIGSFDASLVIDNSVLAGNVSNQGGGGAIGIQSGSLIVSDSDISDNQVRDFSSFGGGVNAVNSDVTITRSTVSRNGGALRGGGIFSDTGDVTIVETTVSDNFAGEFGGGISTFAGDVIVDRSTVSGNVADFQSGGGIAAGGSVTVSNSTFSGNVSGRNGDAIQVFDSSLTISDSTIVENGANGIGAISIDIFDNFTPILLTVTNSIIANDLSVVDILVNEFDSNITLEVQSSLIGTNEGNNLTPAPIGSPDADGNIIGDFRNPIDPVLGELADNGGLTQTHALLVGSPAIDSGNTTLTTDQRGLPRPNFGGNGPDIGAFEEQSLTLIVDTSSDVSDGDFSTGNRSLREAIEQANANEGFDRILFDPLVFDGGADDVIRLVNGELLITEGVLIDTNGLQVVVSGDSLGNDITNPETFIVDIAASNTAESLSDNSRVFNISTPAGELVSLDGLTITGGVAAAGGGGIVVSSAVVELTNVVIAGNRSNGDGGGILTDSELTLQDSRVSSNVTVNGGVGGGIAVVGTAETKLVTLNNSTISENFASASGGGIYTINSSVTLNGSSVTDNLSDDEGGGISTQSGLVDLSDSIVSGNQSVSDGGGINTIIGSITISESTISENSATGDDAKGGGISTREGAIFIIDSTVSGNQSASDGGGISLDSGSLTALRATIDGNSATGSEGRGGGIAAGTGSISLTETTISGNQSVSDGGGIFSEDGLVSFSGSTISANMSGTATSGSTSDGGGIFAQRVTANNSTVSENFSTGRGGGLFVQSNELSLNSSTISGNTSVGDGGGIFTAAADISILSSTVAFNESIVATRGGGLFNVGASTFEVHNSIIAGNLAQGFAADLRFNTNEPLDFEFNLIGTNAATPLTASPAGSPDPIGNLIGTNEAVIDPLLNTLASNGGLTQTHALLPGSPAIDSGNSTDSNDQRGIPYIREAGDAVDIGAYESQRLELLVDVVGDVVDGNFAENRLTLREAVQLANANPGEDLITFDPDQFRGSRIDTIYLSLGELTISESLIIDGEDLGIIISGDARRDDFNSAGDITDIDESLESRLDDNSSVFNITAAAGDLVSLTGLTITGGIGEFGAIANGAADLVISQSNISGNRGTGSGGGIFNDSGSVTIDRTTVSGNRTLDNDASGGGIYSNDGDVTISFSTISDNQTAGAEASGGGIYTIDGAISLTLSTVSGNVTLGSNADGGGISSVTGDLFLDNVTLAQNIAGGEGGGVYVADSTSNPSFILNNTIVADNDATAQPDLGFDSDGLVFVRFSLIGDNTGTSLVAAPVGSPDSFGNLIGTAGSVIDPLLDALANNRGPTFTHQLLAGSPAIDAGNSLFATDQREDPFFTRNDGGGVDIGSLEQFVFNIVVDNSSDVDDGDLSAGNLSLREALSLSNFNPATDTITFDPTVFNGEPADVIRLLDTLTISDGVIIDAEDLGIVISGDVAGDDVLVTGSNLTDTFASDISDTLDDNVRVIEITAGAGELVSFTGVTVTGGSSSGDGGGIRNFDGDLELIRSVLSGNRSGQGGGIDSEDGQITLSETIVSENFSNGDGGGVSSIDGTIIINDSSIINNATGDFDDGGGIHTRTGDVLLNNSSISGNTTGSFGDGGGIYTSSGDVTLNNSSITDNFTAGTSGEGGGIYSSSGDVTLIGSDVSNNTTGDSAEGGGIYASSGDVRLTNSSVSNNTTGEDADGGGIFTFNGDVTLTDSTVSSNSTGDGGDGGGIHTSGGDVTVIRSTISLNQSGENGGGVETFFGDLLFINSTISGNQARDTGGGVRGTNSDSIQFISSTVTNNQSGGDGGGIRGSDSSLDTLTIENSIVAGNLSTAGIGPDIQIDSDVITEIRNSLIGSNRGTILVSTGPSTPDSNGNLIGSTDSLIDPLLADLADNGGPTLTHVALAGSPVINAGGTPSDGVSATDQRGFDRVFQGQIDIGSVENRITGPQVADVILSSSSFSAGFVDAIDGQGTGSGNGLGFSLVGDQQLTSVPWQGIDTLYLQFSADVGASLSDGDILLTGTNGGDYSLGPISYNAATNIASIPILDGIENDSLVISIFVGAVVDSSTGVPVAGDDGEQFNFRFNVLPGDADGSGQVNSQDSFDVFAANTDLTIADNARLDIDGSGQITTADAFRQHLRPTLTVCPTHRLLLFQQR